MVMCQLHKYNTMYWSHSKLLKNCRPPLQLLDVKSISIFAWQHISCGHNAWYRGEAISVGNLIFGRIYWLLIGSRSHGNMLWQALNCTKWADLAWLGRKSNKLLGTNGISSIPHLDWHEWWLIIAKTLKYMRGISCQGNLCLILSKYTPQNCGVVMIHNTYNRPFARIAVMYELYYFRKQICLQTEKHVRFW